MKTTRKNRTARPQSEPATAPTIFPADKLEVCPVRGGALTVDMGPLSDWDGEPRSNVSEGVNGFVFKLGVDTPVYVTHLSNAICGGI